MYYRVKEVAHKVIKTLVPKRYTGEVIILYVPQYKRGEYGNWCKFGDLHYPNFHGYKTVEEAEAHLANHNKKWKQDYEGVSTIEHRTK